MSHPRPHGSIIAYVRRLSSSAKQVVVLCGIGAHEQVTVTTGGNRHPLVHKKDRLPNTRISRTASAALPAIRH